MREDLLSHEQYQKLIELDELDIPRFVKVLKETKIGQGLKFFAENKQLVHCRRFYHLYWKNWLRAENQ